MKDRLTDGIKHIKEIQLTEHERSVMFSRISGYMESTAPKPIPTPFNWFVFAHKTSVFAGLLLFIFSSTAVVVASQDSLPGDVLYPVKVNIKEPIVSAISFGKDAKLSMEVQKANERLAEAEKLSEVGRLSSNTRKEIEVRFEKHVEKMDMFTEVDSVYIDTEVKNKEKTKEDLEKRVVQHIEKLGKIRETLSDEKKGEIDQFTYNVLTTVHGKKDKTEKTKRNSDK